MSRKFLLILSPIAVFILSFSLIQAQERLAPQNLRTAGSTVSWDAVANVSGYRLRWAPPGGQRQFHTLARSQTQYTLPGLSKGRAYLVWVRALGDGKRYEEKGAWSAVLLLRLATATAAEPKELPAPDNLRHVSGSAVAWDAVNGAAGYRLRWGLPGGKQRQFATVADTETQYALTGLSAGVKYRVQVRALGDGLSYEEKGAWSVALPLTLKPTDTATATDTPTATNTPTNTPTDTPTNTPTDTPTNTPTNTPTSTPTDTATNTYTPTATSTDTPSNTPTPLREWSVWYEARKESCGNDRDCVYERECKVACERARPDTICEVVDSSARCGEWQVTVAYHATPTYTATDTPTATNTPTPTNTPTDTPTATNTPTYTPTATNTPTNTPKPTATNIPKPKKKDPDPTNTPRRDPPREVTPPTDTPVRSKPPCNKRKQIGPSSHHVSRYELQGGICWQNTYFRSYWINECTSQKYTVDEFIGRTGLDENACR